MGLTGPIGPLSYFFPQLTMLDLEGNSLTGIIPPDLSNATGLLYVSLANNSLYGEPWGWVCMS
jgi:Leucine-rich repeat (LRR) protein